MAQIYYINKFVNIRKSNFDRIYLDVSRLYAEGISLKEFLDFYQDINNIRFNDLKRKLIILLDEVHYDEKWGLFLKNLFDETKGNKNILVIATGSSALKLKINPDLSRRSVLKELYPLKFDEYLILNKNISALKGISDYIIESIIDSKDPYHLYQKLKIKSKDILRQFAKINYKEEENFLYYGGFPFVLEIKNNMPIIFELLSGMIEKLITKDILELKFFNSQTIYRIKDILYLIANSDSTSIERLCNTLKMDYRTIRAVLDVLVQSGLLIEIKSYGKKFVKVRKPSKFLFLSPSLRVSILNGIIPSEIRGKVLEDYFGLILVKDFMEKGKKFGGVEVMYDSSSGGADFILRIGNEKNIIIEIGYEKGNEGVKQIENTSKNLRDYNYGILIGGKEKIEIINEQILKIPLSYLFSM